jgi:hypothetical protein
MAVPGHTNKNRQNKTLPPISSKKLCSVFISRIIKKISAKTKIFIRRKIMLQKSILILILLSFFQIIAQQITYGPQMVDYEREVKFNWQSGSYIGANQINTDPTLSQKTYLRNGDQRWFVFMQWQVLDSQIPDDYDIDEVEIKFYYDSNDLEFSLSYDNKDITDQNFAYNNYNNNYNNVIGNFNPSNIGYVTINSAQHPSLINIVKDALTSDRVTFIVAKKTEIDIPGKVLSASLKILSSPKKQNVTVYQKYSNNQSFGEIGHYENGNFVNSSSGTTYSFGVNSIQSFQAKTSIDNGEKFNNWNTSLSYQNYTDIQILEDLNTLEANFRPTEDAYVNNYLENTTIADNGDIFFKDAWLRDLVDSKGTRNRGLSGQGALWNSASEFNLTTSSNYQGVFLGQGYDEVNNEWTEPYYSIKTTSPQTISINGTDRTFYFQNWEASNNGSAATFQDANALETPVVFNNEGATVKAIMKGSQLSNDLSGYSKNNQKKTVRTDDGILHMVYESMGKVWYEYSSNSGQTWTLGNYGKALNNGSPAKNPSIDYTVENIVIAYQTEQGIKVQVFRKTGLNYYPNSGPYTFASTASYGEDVNPVIALSYGQKTPTPINSKILLIFSHYPEVGFEYKTADLNISTSTISNILLGGNALPNTSSNSRSQSLVSYKVNTSSKYYHLAYQDGAAVKYKRIVLNGSTLSVDRETTISTGSGFTDNFSPSITVLSDNSPVVSWVGFREIVSGGGLSKTLDVTTEERIVMRRG